MPKAHTHKWERYELRRGKYPLREQPRLSRHSIYYVGYHCKCGEVGYELRLVAA